MLGVSISGDVAVNENDFTIDSAGEIKIIGNITAKNNLQLNNTAANYSINVSGKLQAIDGNFNLLSKGNIELNKESSLVASNGKLVITADGEINDKGKLDTIDDNYGKRYAKNSIEIKSNEKVSIEESAYKSQKHISINAKSLDISGKTGIYANQDIELITSNNANLNNITIISDSGDILLKSQNGSIYIDGNTQDSTYGYIKADGKVDINASNKITNKGTIKGADITLKSINDNIQNEGWIKSTRDIKLIAESGQITNENLIDADEKVDINASNKITNKGTIKGC